MAAELTWRNETGAELRTWHVARHRPLAFTRYCFTSRLYCTIIFFANTPFILCNILNIFFLEVPDFG